MKKRILLFLLMFVVALTSFACGRKQLANFVISENGYDGSDVTIVFYHTMGSNLTDVLNPYIEEFNKIYPNIHVEHKQVGGYDDVRNQINTEITEGNQPNLAYCYPDHVALYNLAKVVVTLDDLIDSKIKDVYAGDDAVLGLTNAQKADFIEGYYEEGKQFGDGLMYTLPFSKSTEVLYYDKTFFDANNLKVPTTWDEMEQVCKQIKEIDPNCTPLGYDSTGNWFITMCEQYGSPYTSLDEDNHYIFNNDTNKNFVKKFREWYLKGYLTTQDLLGAYTSSLFVEQKDARSYMSIGSSAGATHQRPTEVDGKYPFEVGIAAIPQVNPSNPKVISQGPSICIFNSENPQEVVASWLLLKFLTTSVEFQGEFSMASGYIPVLKSVKDNEYYASQLAKADGGKQIALLSVKVGLETESAYFTSPAFNGSSTARDQVGLLMNAVFNIPADVSDLDAKINAIFAEAISECELNG